jgi:hypothetical protein
MRKLLLVAGILLPFLSVQARYVLTTEIEEKGTLEWHARMQGYVIEQEEGDLFSQRDFALKYGVTWVVSPQVKLYLEPPLLRYHQGQGETYDMGFGDMDIGAKTVFTEGIGWYAFLRLPTGNAEMPVADNWCPKFSNNQIGGGTRLMFGRELVKGTKAYLNVGVLLNIGDMTSEDSPIPETRVPFGVGFSFPYGAFVEEVIDINGYGEDITMSHNPRRFVIGIDHRLRSGIKLLIALEHGSWGTGDPPIHAWNYGYGEHEHIMQWNVTIGVTCPIGKSKTKAVEKE